MEFSRMARSHSGDRWDVFAWATMTIYSMVLGIAWWMILRGKSALKPWGIAANLILIFTYAPVLVTGNWRGFLESEHQWSPVILVGVFGVAIFSLPFGHAALTLRSFSRFAARCYIATLLVMLVASIVAYVINGKFGLNSHLPHSLRFSVNMLNALCFVLALPFWIGMIWDCVVRSKLSLLAKALWLSVLVFTNYVGMLVYYFVVFEKLHFRNPSNRTLVSQ